MYCHADGAEFPDSEFESRRGRLWHNGHVADGGGTGVDPAGGADEGKHVASDNSNRERARGDDQP